MKVYCISGLGADHRVFGKLRFPSGMEMVPLPWIPPEKGEELEPYSQRMARSIDRTEPFMLCGLSMGGMVASCIAKIHPAVLTILISSIPVSSALPPYYRFAGKCQLHRIIPISFFTSAAMLKRYFAQETLSDKNLVREMIRNTDPAFIRWAFEAVLHWNFSTVPTPLLHIHGTSDGILPARYTNPTHLIDKGDHLMILSRSEEISALLSKELQRINMPPGA